MAPSGGGGTTGQRIDVLTGAGLVFIKVFSSGVGLYVGTRILGCSLAAISAGAFAALIAFTAGVVWLEARRVRSSSK